ncbi:MAG: hypothetical protein P8J20_00455 [Novosphingobium sp.]|nr:hypothetical protein [Novosphingobium sp.]
MQLGNAVGDAGRELGKITELVAAYVRDEANRRQVIIGAFAALLLLVGLTDNPISNGISGLIRDNPATPQFTEDGLPDFASYEDNFLGEDTGFIVTGKANVRDYPTSEGTEVVRTLQEGETITAREVQAFDPESAWYKLSDGGYIWGGNIDRYDEIPTGGGPLFPANL